MIIYVQYAGAYDDLNIKLEFFAMVPVLGSGSKELFDTVAGAVKDRSKMLFGKWVTFGSDGPSVVIGSQNSAVQRLEVIKPWFVDNHCVGRREPLAAKGAFDSVRHCTKLGEVVHACGSFFSWSTERRVELKDIATANGDDTTQVGMACKTPWLSTTNAATYKKSKSKPTGQPAKSPARKRRSARYDFFKSRVSLSKIKWLFVQNKYQVGTATANLYFPRPRPT